MLVLSRKVGEQIVIPDQRITITVLNASEAKVRFGISAPPGIRVFRKELWVCVADREDHARAEPISQRVLLADSDALLRDAYAAHLAQQGFKVATAASGVECVEKLREFLPDVLVLEPTIPWGGGDGVLAVMREDRRAIPVVLLVNSLDSGVLYRVAPFRISDLQFKPISARRLTDRIAAVAGLKQVDLVSVINDMAAG